MTFLEASTKKEQINLTCSVQTFLLPLIVFEVIAGGSGRWLSVGPLSGRMILFILAFYMWSIGGLMKRYSRISVKGSYHWLVIVLGILYPVMFSVIGFWNGNNVRFIIDEGNGYAYLLLYFLYINWLRHLPGMYQLIVAMSLSIIVVGGVTVYGYLFGANVDTFPFSLFPGNFTRFPDGTNRIVLTAHAGVMFNLIFLVGVMNSRLLVQKQNSYFILIRLLIITSMIIGTISLILTGSRALMITSLISVIVIMLLARVAKIKVLLFIVVFITLSFLLLPSSAMDRFTTSFSINERANGIRFESAQELIKGFLQRPLFGNGLGSILPSGYLRNSSAPYMFELSFFDILFDSGLVGIFCWSMLVIGFLKPLLRWGKYRKNVELLGLILGGLALIAVGSVNPFLLNSVSFNSFALVLAYLDNSISKRVKTDATCEYYYDYV
ncbi:O-antigen ligase family protein [Neomoorella mulderi]|uniref:O-antigen ligase n=1 Tax=Moorella mulderi DSM 14980 TaxID=1122241 RepID=A0A151AZJ6_9FIRM|nr:O-antigen ligase family protein [Moorella mulderi]KYH32827.1 O-antigen ligase [Moorella mulderi DSM 14980]